MKRLPRLCGLFCLVLGSLCFVPRVLGANFLQNSDFESSSLQPWVTSGGGATATCSAEQVHSGAWAIKIFNDKVGSYGFQQAISNLEGGMFYEVFGYGGTKDVNVDSYFIRVAWYESSDGSGSQLTSPSDTDKSSQTNGEWAQFRELLQAPPTAKSAKVRLVLTSKSAGTVASVFFDDITFQESVAPSPTPSLTPTNAPTSTKMPTFTPTLTPPKSPTPTRMSTVTPTNASSAEEATGTSFVLGEETKDSLPATSSGKSLKPVIISTALVALGLAILSGYFVWQKRNAMRSDETTTE